MSGLHRKKKEDLNRLQYFCSQTKISGWCSNMWFHTLIQRYPLHFLLISQFTTDKKGFRDHAKNLIRERMNLRMDNILSMPFDQTSVERIDILLESLNEIYQEQNRKFNN